MKILNQISSTKALEASLLTINFKKHENNGKLSTDFENLKEQILIRRAALGLDKTPEKPLQKKVSPHLSHPDSRISIGIGTLNAYSRTILTFNTTIRNLFPIYCAYAITDKLYETLKSNH